MTTACTCMRAYEAVKVTPTEKGRRKKSRTTLRTKTFTATRRHRHGYLAWGTMKCSAYLVVNTDVGPSGLAGLGVLVWVNGVFAHGDFWKTARGEERNVSAFYSGWRVAVSPKMCLL